MFIRGFKEEPIVCWSVVVMGVIGCLFLLLAGITAEHIIGCFCMLVLTISIPFILCLASDAAKQDHEEWVSDFGKSHRIK